MELTMRGRFLNVQSLLQVSLLLLLSFPFVSVWFLQLISYSFMPLLYIPPPFFPSSAPKGSCSYFTSGNLRVVGSACFSISWCDCWCCRWCDVFGFSGGGWENSAVDAEVMHTVGHVGLLRIRRNQWVTGNGNDSSAKWISLGSAQFKLKWCDLSHHVFDLIIIIIINDFLTDSRSR